MLKPLGVLAVALCACLNLEAGFESVGSLSLGGELQNGKVYTVDGTVEYSVSTPGGSPLKVAPGASAVLFIPKDSKLTVQGGPASGTTGGGAGIEVPENSTLIITGRGSIVAKGGNAASGADGSSGDSGYLIDDNDNPMDEWGHAGAGGKGGAGGGGAGAGIGGHGGEGGSGGSGGYWTWYDTRQNFDHNGTGGDDGSKGGDSYSGAIYILGSIFANATGGSAGSAGGSAGSTGSVDVEHWGLSAYAYRACGGGGGGGGGAGDWAYGYGRGGYGGGGGGGGGGGATYQASWATDDDNSRGGCGGGGSGYYNGSGSQENGVSHWSVTGGNGGYGAGHGSDSPNTWTYKDSGTTVAGNGFFQSADTHYSIEYTLTFSDEWRTNEVRNVKLGYEMPAAPVLPARNRYVFKGWYSGDTCYYNASGASLRAEYDHVGDLTLTAKWQLEDSTAALTVNGMGVVPGVSCSGDGWNYDSATGVLTLSAAASYAISGSSLDGEIVIRAAPPSTGFCMLTLDGVSIDSGNRSGVAAFTLAEHSYVIVNTSSHSSFSSAAGFPGIMLESDARIVLLGQGALVATGGKGAHDIGFASGITDYGKIFIAASAVDFHPGAGRLPGVVGGNGGIYLFQTDNPPRLWAVSVPGFEPGAAVAWSGLPSAYSSGYSTADENGKAWLWLPDGTYNFKSTSGGVEKSWDARVNGAHREAREHIETGLLIDGVDAAYLARPGWYWNERYTLCITNGTPFTVSGATTKIGINVKANGNLTISDLDIKLVADDDHRYAAAIAVDSGRSLRLTLDGESRLNGALYAAAVSVPAKASLAIDGTGRLYATGGGRSAGIGTGLSTVCGAIKIESGWIDARGGTYSPGIGIGDSSGSIDYKGGSLEIAGGTVTAGTTIEPRSSMNIGSSDDAVFDSVKFTGGSIYPVDNKVGPAPTNAAGAQVYRVTIPGQTPNSAVTDIEIPTAPDYGTENIIADADGKIYLWMPAGAHYFRIGGVIYVVDVNSASAVARVWESGLYIDGEPLVELGCKGWRYDFAKEAVVFTNSQTFVVSGSTTNEVLSAGVDCVLIASNLTVDATYDTGKAPFTAETGRTLTIAGGTMSAFGGADGLSAGKVLIKGGSLHTGYEAFGRRPVNVADEAVYMVTVEGFEPGARIVSITRESDYVKDVHDYATEAMFADGDGKIYIWLSSGRYDFMVGVEKGGSVEAVEYIAWVNDADATAVKYEDSGLLVDGRDAAHGAGPGWHSDVTNQVSLAEARTFCVSGETEVMGVLAAEDLTVVVSNLVINGTRVAETAPFTVAEGRNVRLETVETNKFYATVPSAAVYVQKNATVTLDGEGVLYAYSGEGEDKASAAIGSGFRQECGKVVIAGGEVHAISRTYTTPGIGVGETYNLAMKLGGEFEIAGGLVFVSGGKYAADIGPAEHAECGSVAITGGTVLKEEIRDAETMVKIGKSSIESASKLVISGGSAVANTASVYPAATNALGNAVYPVTVEGFQPLARCRVRCQIEYGDKDVFADREGKLHLWFPKGWNYFLVDGEPYRAKIVYDWAAAAGWRSGVYIDDLDAAYVTMGAWKLVDENIDLTNAAPYRIYGETSEFTMRARANLTANLAGLSITRAADTSSPAFLVGGPINVTMTLAATNTMSAGERCAAVQVEGGGKLAISGDGWLFATGGKYGAGIGSGSGQSGTTLEISGGNINAAGGIFAAGIGTGENSSDCTLTISGGNIEATGAERGAGIGGGRESRNIAITVSGGEIKSTAGYYAASIGCGDAENQNTDCNLTVTITGGKMTLVTGTGYSAIGPSSWGKCGKIEISGGTIYPVKHDDYVSGTGRIGFGFGIGGGIASSVVFRGGSIHAETNSVKPAAVNHLSTSVFPLNLDVEVAERKVDSIAFGISSFSYYGCNDIYSSPDGIIRVWLPSSGAKPLPISVTMEDGEQFDFCFSIDDDGNVKQIEFITVNGEFIYPGENMSGDGWTYNDLSGIITLNGDARVSGISTNGTFRLLVPQGGAEELTLHRLNLVAKTGRNYSAIVVSNDVSLVCARSNTVTATGQYAAGVEVQSPVSLTIGGEGSLFVTGGKYGAGIGTRGGFATCGTIVIESGNINACGGPEAAGIGGGLSGSLAEGSIVIKGGVVRAYGATTAPGIGVGHFTSGASKIPSGAVTVEGGTVLAWGGTNFRQPGGMGGTKSWSDLIAANGSVDTSGQLVVKGGSVVAETPEIGQVRPRPVDGEGTQLYSITFTNLQANAEVTVSSDDFPADFGVNDLYSDDSGRLVLWLAPTNHARVICLNDKYYTTDYPYTNHVVKGVYPMDITIDAEADGSDTMPECIDDDGMAKYKVSLPDGVEGSALAVTGLEEQGVTATKEDGDGKPVLYLPDGKYDFGIGTDTYTVEVQGGPATAKLVPPLSSLTIESMTVSDGVATIVVACEPPEWLALRFETHFKVRASSTLPIPDDDSSLVPLEDLDITLDTAAGKATVKIPQNEPNMFYKAGTE